MGFIEDLGHKIYSFMTNPKLVKKILIVSKSINIENGNIIEVENLR